jgi:uncharacterized integral membrane protein (TIGR00697 family)
MKLHIQSNALWLLTLTYSMVIVIANWFDARLIKLAGLVTDAGTLIFPLTFLLSDLITEVYGYKHARRAIWCGFFFNAIFIAYGQLIIHLPSPDFAANNAMFDTLLAMNVRILLASAISYLVAEPLNSLIMAKLKISMHGKHMGVRFVASTIAASAVDSLLFGTIAFYGTMSDDNLIHLIATMWLIKVGIETAGLPVSISLAKKLKQAEKIDMYDNHTHFNLFTLDTDYSAEDNAFVTAPVKKD